MVGVEDVTELLTREQMLNLLDSRHQNLKKLFAASIRYDKSSNYLLNVSRLKFVKRIKHQRFHVSEKIGCSESRYRKARGTACELIWVELVQS